MQQKYLQKGFTIIELLVVIVVIGILAAITVIGYVGMQQKMIDTTLVSDIEQMNIAELQYQQTSNSEGKPYYSGDGSDSDLNFIPGTGNVVDVVTNSAGYCIRGYNESSDTYNTIHNAYEKESSEGTCDQIDPSQDAIDNSGAPPIAGPPAGGGLSFDGQEDYARVASSASLNITNNLTIETWVYPSSVAADDDWRTVVGKLEGCTGGYEMGVDVDQSVLYFDVQLSGGIVATDYTFPVRDTWYHVVGTFQAGPTMKLYVNGALVDDTPQTYGDGPFSGNILTSSKPLYIGGDPADSSYSPREFAGEVDEVRIYSRVLSDTEVSEHYAETFTNESNLVGLWHFDEGSGATITDSSGSGNHGAIIAPAGGYAMSFDGSGDYITVPDSVSLDLTGEFTIEGWIKRDSVPQLSDWRLIVGKTNSSFPTDVYGWMTDVDFGSGSCGASAEGECSLGFFQTNSGAFWLSSSDSLNEWHHFVATYNQIADRVTIYWDYDFNGSNTTANDVPVGDGALYIGGSGSVSDIAPYDFAGDLDEIRFYGKELPANIVQAHLLGDFSQDGTGCGGASCNLRAHWGFNEGSGSTLVDLSGNGNSGVISGNPQWVSAESGAQRETH